MKDLKRTLEERAGRATPVGSEQLRQRVAFTLAAGKGAPRLAGESRRRFRGPLVATAAAVVTLAVIGGSAWLIGGSETRPLIEVPYVVIEGSEDILATTTASATAPAAICPAGSDSNRPGPVDQARPPESLFSPVTMDRQSGRVIAVVPSAGYGGVGWRTWAFDVCTNTWTLMGQPDFHQSEDNTPTVLVYDADSDLVVAIGASVDSYDVDTDTWKRHGELPPELGDMFPQSIRGIYDPVSGLIVVRDIESSKMWAYDVDTNLWTPIRQGPISPPGEDSGAWGQLHAYDGNTDRIVLYMTSDRTWTYDLRAGEWTIEQTETPDLHVGAWWSPLGKATYDETAQRTVITADGAVAGYNATQHEWEILWVSSSEPNTHGVGTGSHHRLGDHIVYDPINDRIIVIGGAARMLEEDPFWVTMNDVWAFDTGTGTWSELLAPTSP